MRQNITLGIIFTILAIFQSSLINIFTLWGVSVNLPLCFFIMSVFMLPKESINILYGVMLGLYLDITLGAGFGIKAFAYLLTGILTVLLKRFLNDESKISVVVVGFSATSLYQFITYFLTMALYGKYSVVRFLSTTGILLTLNLIFCFVIYFVMNKFRLKRPKISRYERYEII